jgi:DNA primase
VWSHDWQQVGSYDGGKRQVDVSVAASTFPAMPAVGSSSSDPADEYDVVELVGQHTTLRRLGGAQLQGACPFCRSTALRVRPSHGTFHCFGCGEGGDAAMFLTKIRCL